jgi:hypothetical protein
MTTPGTTTIRVRGFPNPIQFADWRHDRLFHTIEFAGNDTQELIAFVGAVGNNIPGGGRVLTAMDTNLSRSGDTGLQEGWEMLIYSIQIQVVREVATNAAAVAFQDANGAGGAANRQFSRPPHVGGYDPTGGASTGGVMFDFLRKVYHQFTVNGKSMTGGPIEKYPQGSGISVFSTGNAQEIASNGPPSPRDQSAFVLPIWLRPGIGYASKFTPIVALGIGAATAATPFATINGYFDWSAIPATTMAFDVRTTLEGLVKIPVVAWFAPFFAAALAAAGMLAGGA